MMCQDEECLHPVSNYFYGLKYDTKGEFLGAWIVDTGIKMDPAIIEPGSQFEKALIRVMREVFSDLTGKIGFYAAGAPLHNDQIPDKEWLNRKLTLEEACRDYVLGEMAILAHTQVIGRINVTTS